MVRTQIYLTREEKSGIDSIATMQGIPQSVLIRRAIDDLLSKEGAVNKAEAIRRLSGVWRDKKGVPDVRRLRRGWRRGPAR